MRMSLDCSYLIPEPDIANNSKTQEEFRNTAPIAKESLSTLQGCGHPKIKMSVSFYLIISQNLVMEPSRYALNTYEHS